VNESGVKAEMLGAIRWKFDGACARDRKALANGLSAY
jgi:hypothetical protein